MTLTLSRPADTGDGFFVLSKAGKRRIWYTRGIEKKVELI